MGSSVPKNLIQHSFATGEVSPSVLGRQDLTRYVAGLMLCEKFQISPQGGLYSDTGTVFVNIAKYGTSICRIIPFEFSNEQAYILEFGNGYVRFYANGGRIENPPGTPVEVATPYADTDLEQIQFTQSADFLYLVHPNYPPAAITRTSNLDWNYTALSFRDGPYQDSNDDPTRTMTVGASVATTGSLTTGSTSITSVASTTGMVVGMAISGNGIPLGATVTAIGSGTLTISSAATLTGSTSPITVSTLLTVGASIQVTANFNAFFAGNVDAPIRLEEPVTSKYDAWVSGVCYPNGYLVTNAGSVYQCSSGGIDATSAQHPLGIWQNAVGYPTGYYVYWGINCYKSTTTGTAGNTPPTHTSGTASDGGVTWQFIGAKSGIRAPVHGTGTQSDGNLNWVYLHSGYGWGIITGYISPTQVQVTIVEQLPNSVTGGTLRWRLGAWDTYNGFPSCICFYDGRLVFASTQNQPQTLWMSNTGDFYNFAPTSDFETVLDTNTINVTLASGNVNKIVWLNPMNRLLVGTIGGEWQIMPAVTTSGFSPSNIQAKQQSANGSADVQVRLVNLATLYVNRSMHRVLEMTYTYLIDGYQSKDLNLMNDQVLREGGGIVDTAYTREPFSTYWMLRADGVLVGLTYLADEEVLGWHRHSYSGFIESVASIPSNAGGNDELWLVMRREINGQTVRYIEKFQDQFYPKNSTDTLPMWYVESGLSLQSATPVDVVEGLGYLEGQTVVPIVDGAVQPTSTVTSGQISLQTPGKSIVVGLPYTALLTILPLDFEGPKGSLQGQDKVINKVSIRVINSIGYSYGSGPTLDSNPTSFPSANNLVGQAPTLFSGVDSFNLAANRSTDGTFSIGQTQPYPLNILSIITSVVGYDQ